MYKGGRENMLKKYAVIAMAAIAFMLLAWHMIQDIGTQEENEGQAVFALSECTRMAGAGGCEIVNGFEGQPPVLDTVNGSWESVDVLNPSVIRWNGQYYNYYSGWDGTTWRTGLATSQDGIEWERSVDNPILDVREEEWDSSYIAANGSAVVFNDKIYYFYQGKDADTGSPAIGLAVLDEGIHVVTRTKEPVISAGGGV